MGAQAPGTAGQAAHTQVVTAGGPATVVQLTCWFSLQIVAVHSVSK
jgi:hypothetical protein